MRWTLSGLIPTCLSVVLYGCGGGGGGGGGGGSAPPDPVPTPSYTYTITGAAVKGIIVGATVRILNANGSAVGQSSVTDASGRYTVSATLTAPLLPPLQIHVDGTGARSRCDAEPGCEVDVNANGVAIVAGYGDLYDLPDGFRLRAAVRSLEETADDQFEAAVFVSPLSEFVVAEALSLTPGAPLSIANLDVANADVAELLTGSFPSLPLPDSIDIATIPLLDLTNLASAESEEISELSLAVSSVSAVMTRLVEVGSSTRGNIRRVLDDLSGQISASAGGSEPLIGNFDRELLARASVNSLADSLDVLAAAADAGTITLPDQFSIADLREIQQDSAASLAQVIQTSTHLSPGEQTEPVTSTAAAWADMTLLPTTGDARVILRTQGIDATAAHLHSGFAGTNGPVVVPLEQDSGNSNLWALLPDTTLDADLITAILAGGIYFNVHSSTYPSGELRGQVLTGNVHVFIATPAGLQDVPEPVNSTGFARAAVTLNRDTNIAEIHFTSDNIEPFAAHIHQGAAGTNGPVVIDLSPDPLTSGHWFAEGVEPGNDLIAALDSAGLYFNLHTAAHPTGELRAQIVPPGYVVQISRLRAGHIVSDEPVDSTASAVAATTLRLSDGTLSIHLNSTDIADPMAVHVHLGNAGENGTQLFELSRDPLDDRHWLLEGVHLTSEQQTAFFAGNLYMDVHTAAFPDGEIRGQLEDAGIDTDGDGVADVDDAFPNDPNESADSDGDGVGDNADDFPTDPSETKDSDGDGVGDNADAFPLNDMETTDSDGDGTGDNADACPLDPEGTVDADNDGICDSSDPSEIDSDGDGVSDEDDAFPNDPNESADSDGDGVGDNADAFPNDAQETVDTDGDGVGDNADAFPNDASETNDSDGDGVGDNADAFPNDPSETSDGDGDGVGNNSDNCPNIANASQTDTDNDGVGDACEVTAPPYSQVQAIFNNNCVTCHGISGGLNLSASVSYDNLVNVPSVGVPGVDRVEPGVADSSYLIWKLEGRAGIVGARMPFGGAPLAPANIDTIRAWINGGAIR